MLAEDGLVRCRQHLIFWGVGLPPIFFAFLFSQILATYNLEVPCHPLSKWLTSNPNSAFAMLVVLPQGDQRISFLNNGSF